mmetsp:Transcript_1773/g.3551  ORF Transcript_1773/g.3551 Transcript_1773/m.3551 type:complete len:321 (+) Transcript_1773:194-1156(+)
MDHSLQVFYGLPVPRFRQDHDRAIGCFLHPERPGQFNFVREFRVVGQEFVVKVLVIRRRRAAALLAVGRCDPNKGPKVEGLALVRSTPGILDRPVHVRDQLLVQDVDDLERQVDHAALEEKARRALGGAAQHGLQFRFVPFGAPGQTQFLERFHGGVVPVGRDVQDGRESVDDTLVVRIPFLAGFVPVVRADDGSHRNVLDHQVAEGRCTGGVGRARGRQEVFDPVKELLAHVAKGKLHVHYFGAGVAVFLVAVFRFRFFLFWIARFLFRFVLFLLLLCLFLRFAVAVAVAVVLVLLLLFGGGRFGWCFVVVVAIFRGRR